MSKLFLSTAIFLLAVEIQGSSLFNHAEYFSQRKALVNEAAKRPGTEVHLWQLEAGLQNWELRGDVDTIYNTISEGKQNMRILFRYEEGGSEGGYVVFIIFSCDSGFFFASGSSLATQKLPSDTIKVSKTTQAEVEALLFRMNEKYHLTSTQSFFHRGMDSSHPSFAFIDIRKSDSTLHSFFIQYVKQYQPRKLDQIENIIDILLYVPKNISNSKGQEFLPGLVPLPYEIMPLDSFYNPDSLSKPDQFEYR